MELHKVITLVFASLPPCVTTYYAFSHGLSIYTPPAIRVHASSYGMLPGKDSITDHDNQQSCR